MRNTAVCVILVFMILCPVGNHAYSDGQRDNMKAFLMSLIIPGAGQYYAGSPGYAKIFIASELAIWGCYYYNSTMKDASRQDYFSHAALYAGVNLSGSKTSYINAMGGYTSSFDYNKRQIQLSSNPVLYSGDQTWEWDREEDRLRFRNLRERELDYENNIKFCIAGIIFNHFLAALNASRQAQKFNEIDSAVTVNVLRDGLGATYTRSF